MEIAIPEDNLELRNFIMTNQLNPMATDCLLRCSPEVQVKVMSRGPCDPKKVRDQVAVIKKRIQLAQIGRATGICGQEVENFISQHPFDEKAKDVFRASSNQVQRIVLDRGTMLDATNPSAELLMRVRKAHEGAVFMDGRPKVVWEGPLYGGKGGGGGGPTYGDAAGSKRGAASMLESEAGVPVVTWLTFGANSHFVQAGFDADGAAIMYNKKDAIFGKAHDILLQVVGNRSSIQCEHDEKWAKFPGIGEQFKKETGEENAFAVATSTEHDKWGVGFHYGQQGREESAKLALAIAIALGTEMENRIGALFPDFAIICDESAIGREVVKSKYPKLTPPSQAQHQVQQAAQEVSSAVSARAGAAAALSGTQLELANAQATAEAMAAEQAAAEWKMNMQMAAMEAHHATEAASWQMQVQSAMASSMAAFGHNSNEL